MDEKALQYAYELFQADGYTGSVDDFKNLIDTNPDAFNYSFELFKADGYQDSIDDFATLLGVKKKDNLDVLKPSLSGNTMGSGLEAGGLEQSMLEQEFRAEQDSINLTGSLLVDKQNQLNTLNEEIESRDPALVGGNIPVTQLEFDEMNRLRDEIDSLETDYLTRQEKLDSLRFEIPDDVEVEINQEAQESYDPYKAYNVQNPRQSFLWSDASPQGRFARTLLGDEAIKKFNANMGRLISNISRPP